MKTVKTRGSEYSSEAKITVSNNAEFFPGGGWRGMEGSLNVEVRGMLIGNCFGKP